jgi:prepilin-type N-terminal cleavage/methylation domain-containing protein
MEAQTMARRAQKRQGGFTLLEVLIAMSILAVGAASILSIFVWAIAFHTKRVEGNRLAGVYNHALEHARAKFNEFDPGAVPPGQPLIPPKIVADLSGNRPDTTDPMILDAWEKFRGFQYTITFEDNDLAVPGSSVVVDIEIRGLSGEVDESSHKWFLSRTNAPARERFRSPSMDEEKARSGARKKGGP